MVVELVERSELGDLRKIVMPGSIPMVGLGVQQVFCCLVVPYWHDVYLVVTRACP